MSKNIDRNIPGQILEYIQNKNMSIGDILPSERHLAELIKASRNSVREALKKLEALEILEIKRSIKLVIYK